MMMKVSHCCCDSDAQGLLVSHQHVEKPHLSLKIQHCISDSEQICLIFPTSSEHLELAVNLNRGVYV